jgi:hypothetical protein
LSEKFFGGAKSATSSTSGEKPSIGAPAAGGLAPHAAPHAREGD